MAVAPIVRLARRHPRYFAHLLAKRAQFRRRYRWVRRNGGSAAAAPPPLVYKLLLNWKCNLRCPMCMQWGEVGWVKEAGPSAGDELDDAVLDKLLDAPLPPGGSYVLSGGEPLMHPRFGDIARRLKERRAFATVCTNGLLIDRFLDVLDGNPYPTLLVSLDGFEDATETLRGRGVYRRVLNNIAALQTLRRPPFVGVQFTVMPENVAQMEPFCEAMIERGVDWILLNPGWFLSPRQAERYEREMKDRFDVTATTHRGYVRAYDYDAAEFERQLRRIRARRWPIQIASYLKEPEWVADFIAEPDKLLGNRLCYKQWLRVDVLPDGKVAPCVQFPDLTVGDLHEQGLLEIWHGEANRRFQRAIRDEPLSICAKCNNIYLYDGR